jgi:serine/threonine protein kinase/Tol biopolymer transport system component
MITEQWRDVERIYHEALLRPPGKERAMFVAKACAGDMALRGEIELVLRQAASGEGVLNTPGHPVSATSGSSNNLLTRQLGVFQITALLGVGGMGEVYRARDTRLGRDVAIKFLARGVSDDAHHLMRLEREARILATLNHPNIGAIYGLEEVPAEIGGRALVLELVNGETLAERIRRGPASVAEALTIARQIAEALGAAHEKGIIHRDLKPANIKITPDGIVKVLDFGIAKATRADAASDSMHSPTVALDATRDGALLGTVAYMSPEQVRGEIVDKRADIWAFGCVLFEMLTGERAFPCNDVSVTLEGVLTKEPDWTALSGSTPPAIRTLLRRCFAKDRRQRLSDATDARLEIEEAQTAPTGKTGTPLPVLPGRGIRRTVVIAGSAALIAGSLVTVAALWIRTRPPPPGVIRTTIMPSAAASLTLSGFVRDLALSPDATRLVYVGANGTQLFVRALDQLAPAPLADVGAPGNPVFSPNGQSVTFFDGSTALKRVSVTGGASVAVTSIIGFGRGASWGPDDAIIFATVDTQSGLLRVPAAGGDPEVLTTPDSAQGEVDHFWPELLPGGQAVLFTITSPRGIDQAQVAVLDLRTKARKVLVRGGTNAQYVAPGYLLYGAAGTLRAVPFDLRRLAVVGSPVSVLEGVATTPQGAMNFSVAADGTLIYVPGGPAGARRTMVWVDRRGGEEATGTPARAYLHPRLSPDGTKVAVDLEDQDQDIWIWNLERQTLTRFTFNSGVDIHPTWTPDGNRLVFASQLHGPNNLYWQAMDGSAIERLTESRNTQFPYNFTPNGTQLLLREDKPGTGQDLSILALKEQRRVTPPSQVAGRGFTNEVRSLLQTPFLERNGEVSPDGRWLAYESNESREFEIYVRPFPSVEEGRSQVSRGGGMRPVWARGGRELFYLAPDGSMMAVPVDESKGRAPFAAGTPVKLFAGAYFVDGAWVAGRSYDVSPDGQRFLMIKQSRGTDDAAAPTPIIVVVQNWLEELKRLVPTN